MTSPAAVHNGRLDYIANELGRALHAPVFESREATIGRHPDPCRTGLDLACRLPGGEISNRVRNAFRSTPNARIGWADLDAPYVHRLRVRYHECDLQGIVFNANHFS